MAQLQPVNTAYCLEQLFEGNFAKLLKLLPDLANIREQAMVSIEQKPALYFDVIERSRYTATIVLSHYFQQATQTLAEPGLTVRIYWDAQLAEAVADNERPQVARIYKDPGQITAIRDYKWRLNYFLSQWLDHCL